WKGVAEPNSAVWSGLDVIVGADRGFAPQGFLSGARVAYDMVVHAFAAGDSATLRNLMTPEAFANFDNAIRARAAAGQTMTTTVVSIDDATIVGAQLVGSVAQLRVRFAAKLASVTRDAEGAAVEGSPNTVADHIDVWTFARDIHSRDPNWQLTATESES
ncbi:MAG: Tim44/TimA family putative adaptor protein, partial [Roseiarcus sp.]